MAPAIIAALRAGALGRFMGPLLVLNLVMYVIVLCIAGSVLDSTITPSLDPIYMNAASKDFTVFSLIAGMVGIASLLQCLHLVKDWRHVTRATVSAATTLIAWLLLLLALGLACKEINVGGVGTILKFLEAFVIILTVTQGLLVLLLHVHALETPPTTQ